MVVIGAGNPYLGRVSSMKCTVTSFKSLVSKSML